MATGRVKFFNQDRGFGFIIDDNSQKEVFVHFSGLLINRHLLNENDEVTFDYCEDERGPKAVNVKKNPKES